jgi:hypothetical protein
VRHQTRSAAFLHGATLSLLATIMLLPGCLAPPGVYDADAPYCLPYQADAAACVGQGNNGLGEICKPCSHYHEYAIDFLLAQGTPVVAARSGVVYNDPVSDCPDCTCPWGPTAACPGCCANRIIIEHADGSRASYAHLMPGGVCVVKGQAIERGDIIGFSGNTGRSMTPHLEFRVYAPAGQTGSGSFGESADGSMEVRFADVNGGGVPQFLHVYISQNWFDPNVNRDWCEH